MMGWRVTSMADLFTSGGTASSRGRLVAALKDGPGRLWSEFLDLLYPEPPPCLLCRGAGDLDASISVCRTCTSRIAVIGRRRCDRCGRAVGERAKAAGHTRAARRIGRSRRGLTCAECMRSQQGFDLCRAYGVYEGYLRSLVHQLKYGGDAAVGRGLGELMAWVVARDPAFGNVDAVVAVPLHPRRSAERGYNQSELLAARVAAAFGRPLVAPVARILETTPQSKLPFHERDQNVRRAFAVTRPADVRDKRFLLVDDVLTTGSTLSALARTLKRAGARRCTAVCAAAGSLDRDFAAKS